jgi:hypothetical protein
MQMTAAKMTLAVFEELDDEDTGISMSLKSNETAYD